MSITGEEIIFQNGTVFDGRAFLPPGTCVRVRGGTITAVGQAGEVLERAEVAELRQFLRRLGVILRLHVTFAGAVSRLGSERALLVLDDRLELRQRRLGVALGGQTDAQTQLDSLG